jgi:hypothetical protein
MLVGLQEDRQVRPQPVAHIGHQEVQAVQPAKAAGRWLRRHGRPGKNDRSIPLIGS